MLISFWVRRTFAASSPPYPTVAVGSHGQVLSVKGRSAGRARRFRSAANAPAVMPGNVSREAGLLVIPEALTGARN
jgi:hypothetical protein